jgi:hypothetical protein
MANLKFNRFGRAIAQNDLDTVTIKAMFMDPAYTPDPDAHAFVSDISASRASGTTDLTVAGLTITVDNTDNRTEFDINDLVTGTITVTGGTNGIVFYISTGVDATSELLCYCDILVGGVQTTVFPIAGTFTGTISANGIFSI